MYVEGDTRAPLQLDPDDFYVAAANRPASGDSRQFGPVPGRYLIGCGWLTYWPTDR